MYEEEIKNNVERFSGFSDCYDKYRPETSEVVIDILSTYKNHKPSLVIDLGCGTGLSAFIWCNKSEKVIGIEPNKDMISQAISIQKKSGFDNIDFIKSISTGIDLDSDIADIITCSQSFHWMEPSGTLKEVSRLLKSNGIFAVYDCDWPPTVDEICEREYISLMKKANNLIDKNKHETIKTKQWNKNEHLKNISESNLFRFTKEIVFHNIETCDSERFIGIALSQGHLQTVLKNSYDEIGKEIEIFKKKVEDRFHGNKKKMIFSYRMRIGIK
jgi:ubiquinone/menaquinone biosynthesis C-methylase UbiE